MGMQRFSMPQMYLRPGQIFLWFTVEHLQSALNSRGREVKSWEAAIPPARFQGTKAAASQDDTDRYKQAQHPISHTIAAPGPALAVAGDRLKTDNGSKPLYIQGVENPGGLNLWTVYQCEERLDERSDD